jgi:hypothetical protein
MAQWRAGGYVIRQYATDHDPPHVHVYRDRDLMAKVAVPGGSFIYLKGEAHRGRQVR